MADGERGDQAEFSAEIEDMVTLLDRYREAAALLNTLRRGSREYASQLKVEMDLSRQIRGWGQDRARGVRD